LAGRLRHAGVGAAIAAVVVFATGGVGIGTAGAFTGGTLSCGQPVTAGITLTKDLNCSSFGGSFLLDVTQSGVTINLNGHTIYGPLTGYDAVTAVVDDADGMILENGKIARVGHGVSLRHVAGSSVTGITFSLGTSRANYGIQANDGSSNSFSQLTGTSLKNLVWLQRETRDTVSSNTSHGATNAFLDEGGANDTLSGNSAFGDVDNSYVCDSCSGVSFTGNLSQATADENGFLDSSPAGNDSYTSNTVGASGGDGFNLSGGRPFNVQNNTVQSTVSFGISIRDGYYDNGSGDETTFPGSTVSGNIVSGSLTANEIDVVDPIGATVANNTASGAKEDGVSISGVGLSTMAFTGNTAKTNHGDGIQLSEGEPGAEPTFSGNTASTNGNYGIEYDPFTLGTAWDGHGSIARNNGGSADCANISCAGPTNTTLPAISGAPTDGQALTGTRGSWSISGINPSYVYAWLRCDASGSNCIPVTGAGVKHTLAHADVGSTYRFQVTATDDNGSTQAQSAATAVVAPLAPVNTAPPTITGNAAEGSTLTGRIGSWNLYGGATLSFQWFRCDNAGTNCSDTGMTSATYLLTPPDIGSTLQFRVTATNSAASVSASSIPTAVVVGVAPANTALPGFSGTVAAGYTLTGRLGSWKGTSPVAFAYQWLRDGSAIGGATNSTFALTDADVGHGVSLQVTATNSYGQQTVTSAAATVSGGVAPSNTSPPTIGGSALDGAKLTAHPGAWAGSPTIAIAYQWYRCDAGGGNCAAIDGQTASSYTLTQDDEGSTMVLQATGTNAYGSQSALSAATAVVTSNAPNNTGAPHISGTPKTGHVLTGNKGTWTGAAPIAFAYQWLLCDASGDICLPISGAVDTTLTIDPSYVGHAIRLQVSASNADGTYPNIWTDPVFVSS
jgi:hypothetical protein